MTIEEKAKAYDEAIKIAKETYNTQPMYRNWLESMFPELQENEIKDMREKLIKAFGSIGKKEWGGVNVKDVIHWLEKQGEPSDKTHYWTEEEIEPIISDYLRGAEHYGGMIGRLRCLKPKSIEKQGEKSLTVDIDSMVEAYEQRLINQGNGVRNSPIVNMCVAAFKHGVENTLDELHLKQGETSPILSNSSNIGKDEQKPAWSIKEKLMLNDIIETTERSNIFKENYQRELIDWLKSLKNRVLPQPKQEWSEEDEKMCQETIDWFEKKCFPYALENENPARESIKWLKSLKQRIGE